MKKSSFITILFLCVFVCISTAHAVPLIYNFSGTVSEYLPSNDPWGWLGSQMEVTMTVDSNKAPYLNSVDGYGNLQTWYHSDSLRVALDGAVLSGYVGELGELHFFKSVSNNMDFFQLGVHNLADEKSMLNIVLQFEYCHFGDVAQIPLQYGDVLEDPDDVLAGGIWKWTTESQEFVYRFDDAQFSSQAVPEPTAMLLFGAGLVGLAGFGRKKFKK